jgi:cell division protein FtsZ
VAPKRKKRKTEESPQEATDTLNEEPLEAAEPEPIVEVEVPEEEEKTVPEPGEGGTPMSSSQSTSGAVIRVIGVGGAGSNAVDRMIEVGLQGVDFVAANTDVQALARAEASVKLQLGPAVTNGLGSGGDPEVGARASEESRSEIKDSLEGADLVFITGGMGGGTGTGGAPIIAEVSRELGALTVAVVTKPFAFERGRRHSIAEEGLDNLRTKVDTLITVPNDRLLGVVQKKVTLIEAFHLADEVLREGVQGISDLITVPGLINLDFADVKAVIQDAGSALMGIGTGSGETRAADAAQAAISSPLLETTMDGASRILFNISGGSDLSLSEVEEAAKVIAAASDSPDTNVLFGVVLGDEPSEEVRVTVLATGFEQGRRVSKPAAGEEDMPAVEPVPDADLEVPTFLRNR